MSTEADLLMQVAQWAGHNALPLYVFTLVLLVSSTFGIHRLLRPDASMHAISATVQMSSQKTWVVGGASLVGIGAGTFAILASQIGPDGYLTHLDRVFTDALRESISRPVVQVFSAITHLGDTATLTALCIAIAVALIAARHRWLALGWVVSVGGNGLLNQSLKHAFGRLRPLIPSGDLIEPGYSFPSGHSSGAVVVYGMLTFLALRLLPLRWHSPALCVAVALAFSIGVSRLFMRVHFASDVLAGFASGTAWLAVCITCLELTRRNRLPRC